LDQYKICPIVGVIPDNKDTNFLWTENANFWNETVPRYVSKNWTIAQHGCHHLYQPNIKSEFTGLSYQKQEKLIRYGYSVMTGQGIIPSAFFAPAHNFDNTTIDVCRNTQFFRFISDGFALYPYLYRNMLFIPSLFDTPKVISPFGIFTFVSHPNTMDEKQFITLKKFLESNRHRFVSAEYILNVIKKQHSRNIFDHSIEYAVKLMRKVRSVYSNE
jgi:hypothetical protein